MVNIRKFLQGIGLIPVSSTAIDTKGEMEVLSTGGKLNYHNGTSASPMVTEAHSATLTNKTIDADGTGNSITNIENADIKVGAAIDAAKIADGSVSSTEFQYINSVTSNVQTQLDDIVAGTTPITLANGSIFVGNGSNDAVAVDTAAQGDITASATGLNINTGTIVNADINASAAIDASKIADGSVSSTEFQYLSTVTSDIQTQLNGKQTTALTSAHILVGNGSNLATDVAMSGDISISNTGATAYTGTVPVNKGGTGATSLTSNGVVIGNGTSAVTVTAEGATGTVLRGSTGNDPAFGAVVLTTDVTGVLPAANVGLGRTINAQTGTTYTFVLSDGSAAGANTVVSASNGSAQTYTVPPNSSVAFPVGTQIDVIQLGSGKVTLAQGAGVTINSLDSNKAIAGQYVGVTLTKTATDTWILIGHLIA